MGSSRRSRTFWFVLAGLGCLGALLVLVCAGLALTVFTLEREEVPPALPDVITPRTEPIYPVTPVPTIQEQVLLLDSLADATTSSLLVSEDAQLRYAFEAGTYVIELKQPDLAAWSLVEGTYGTNLAVQVELLPLHSDVAAAAGIIFHFQDDHNFYSYTISNDGLYSLDLLRDNRWMPLINWTPSEAIATAGAGSGPARNVLRVECVGERIALFANGMKLEETLDGTFTQGRVALFASSFDQGGALGRFDNVRITRFTR